MATPCIVPAMHVAAGTGRVVAGRYYLQDPIGRGAMGTVWRARDALLARDVAVKEVLLRGASTPEDTRVRYERTLREARTAARLNHPAVVTIFDVVEADGCPWIVMELVQARSLEQILAQDGPLPPHKAAQVGARVLGALGTAHAAGILHRDVKPSNVLLGASGRAVLTDFGIATLAGDSTLTQVGMVMGTPGFTAPERIRGEPATPASDLWSLGATLYAAVDGHGPFDGRGSSLAVLSIIANEDAPRPRSAGALGPAIDALLQRDPRARPDAAAAGKLLAAALLPPTNNRPPADGYLWDAFEGDAFQGDAFQGDAFRPNSFQSVTFQGEAFHSHAFRDTAFQDDAPGDDAFHGSAFRENTLPDGPAGGAAGASGIPAGRTFAGQDGPHGSRLTVPQLPVAELPAWGSSSLEERPPEGIGPPAGGAVPGLMDTPLPGPADLPRAVPRGGRAAPILRRAGHSPGRHGTRAGYRRRLLAGLGAAALASAGILGWLAIGHAGRSPLPAGYQWHTIRAAGAGTAGFTMAVPNGWQVSTHGFVTDVVDPAGHGSIQVDLMPFEVGSAFGEASLLAERAVTNGRFPGYQMVTLRYFLVHGSLGAMWNFTWQEPGLGRVDVRDVLFRGHTQAGRQAYRIQISAPAADSATSGAIFAEALRTFAPR
jgi:eukaryotic-like serine/threonine-protein kinase